MIDYDALKVVIDALSLAFAVGACVYAWRVKRTQATKDEIAALKERAADLDARMRAVPGRSEFAGISERITAVDGEIKALRAEVHGVRDLLPGLQQGVNMLNSYLLKAKL